MKQRVMVVDDEKGIRELLEIVLRKLGIEVALASSGREAMDKLGSASFDVIVSDIRMPDVDGIELLQHVKQSCPDTAFILITAYASVQTAISALKLGAYDYLIKPFDMEEFKIVVQKAIERRRLIDENRYLRSELSGVVGDKVVHRSAAMSRVLDLVKKIAGTSSTVLLTGESGTGKEVIARVIHSSGPRHGREFMSVNCGAIPDNLLESELFGHVRGAFTDAKTTRRGLFELADGGSLLLDEVGEMPLNMQVKLLRVLQDKRVRPVGGSQELPIDVRLIAATNQDLDRSVAEGRFREDLFYRLNVIRIDLPPLRARREDIVPLAELFRTRFVREQGKNLKAISPEALVKLEAMDWPGNVRELENAVERAVTLATGEILGPEDFPNLAGPPLPELIDLPETGIDLEAQVDQVRRRYIEQALGLTGGHKADAARRLGISFRSLRYYVKKYGILASTGSPRAEPE